MPQPSEAESTAALVALYMQAESSLLQGIANIVRHPSAGATGLSVDVLKVRALSQAISTALYNRTPPLVQAAIAAAVREGAADVQPEVERVARVHHGLVPNVINGGSGGSGGSAGGSSGTSGSGSGGFDFSIPKGQRSAQNIATDLTSELDDVRFRITRLPDDIYKIVAPQAAVQQVLASDATPLTAQASAYKDFIRQGITGFTDKSGREWSISAYTEMAVRTATSRSRNAAGLEVMQAAGIDLFTVDDDGHPCPLCFPWQGRILSVQPDKRAFATIEQATIAGLFHPNCRHALRAVIPGVTAELNPQEWTPAHQAAYQATQKQRRLELEIRKAKKQMDYAADPDQRAEAKADVKTLQAAVRKLIAENPDLKLLRQSRREQPNLSLSRN